MAIKPFVWGEETDQALLARTLAEDVPQVLDYLEGELPPAGFLFGGPSIADVAIARFASREPPHPDADRAAEMDAPSPGIPTEPGRLAGA